MSDIGQLLLLVRDVLYEWSQRKESEATDVSDVSSGRQRVGGSERLYIPRFWGPIDRAISQAEHFNGGCPFIRRMLPPILLSIHGMGGRTGQMEKRDIVGTGRQSGEAACSGSMVR